MKISIVNHRFYDIATRSFNLKLYKKEKEYRRKETNEKKKKRNSVSISKKRIVLNCLK